MSKSSNQRGFSGIETVLVLVIVALVAFVGWYVYHAKSNSDKALDAATSTSNNAGPRFAKAKSTPAAGSTSNQSLQTDLNNATNTSNQSNQNLSTGGSSLNDQSTFTSVPQ